jgi:hypothetical protein
VVTGAVDAISMGSSDGTFDREAAKTILSGTSAVAQSSDSAFPDVVVASMMPFVFVVVSG